MCTNQSVGVFLPFSSLSQFRNKEVTGNWRLTISPSGTTRAGTLFGWGISFQLRPFISWSYSPATSTLMLSGSDTIAQFSSLLALTLYGNNKTVPNDVQRQFIISCVDEFSVPCVPAQISLNVHNAPQLYLSGSGVANFSATFVEKANQLPISQNLAIRFDTLYTIDNATVEILNVAEVGQESLSINCSFFTNVPSSTTRFQLETLPSTAAYESCLGSI